MMTILNQHPEIFLTDESRVMVWATRLLVDEKVWEETQILNADKGVFRPILTAYLRFTILDYYRSLAGSLYTYWGDKMPHLPGASYFEAIRELYPDAKIINLHRDPRSVVASLIERGWTDLREGTALWCSLTKDVLEYQEVFGPEQFLSVHYPDLLGNRKRVTHRCLDFLGLKMGKDLYNWLQLEGEVTTVVSEPTAEIGTPPGVRLIPTEEWYVVSQCRELMETLGYKTKGVYK
jgi:hypothetical protein